jgi:hypothetical protein
LIRCQRLGDRKDVDTNKLSIRNEKNMDDLWDYCGSWCFVMMNFFSFAAATGVLTVVGHRGDHALDTTCFKKIELCNYED